jgi:hypothetical protein
VDSTPQTSAATEAPAATAESAPAGGRLPSPKLFYVFGYVPCGVCRGAGKIRAFDGEGFVKCHDCTAGYVVGRVPLEEALAALGYEPAGEAAHA